MSEQPWYKKVFSRDPSSDPVVKDLSNRLHKLSEELESDMTAKFYDVEPSGFNGTGGQFELAGLETTINPITLLRLYSTEPWVYSAVMAVAETIAGTPWKLKAKKIVNKKIVDDSGQETTVAREIWVETTGKLFDLFQYPNRHASRTTFLLQILIDLLVTGNAYIYLDSDEDLTVLDDDRSDDDANSPFGRLRTALGKDTVVKEMYRIPAQLIVPVPKTDPEDGYGLHGYVMTSEMGAYGFTPAEIVHIKFPNPLSQWTGLSPLMAAILRILLDRYSAEHMVRFYKSGARLGGMIETDKNLTKEQITRMQRSFENDFTGRQNFYRTLVLPNGMKYKPIEQDPVQSSVIELANSNREAILSVLRVPPIKVGVMDHANYANANAQLKIFYDDTVKPRCKMLEDAFNMKASLIPDNHSYKIEFDFTDVSVLQENHKEKADAAKVMIESGLTINEVRRMAWKAEPIDGGDKAKAVEDLNKPAPQGFPVTGASATPGSSKEVGDASYDALAQLPRTAVTSIMNIVGRHTSGKIAAEAAASMIQAFGLSPEFAHKLVGLEYVPPAPAPEPVEQKSDVTPPANQPELAGDINPTGVTFEARVAQLTAEFMSRDKLSLADAIAKAIAQAKTEGLGPQDDPTDPSGNGKPPSPETSKDGDKPSLDAYLASELAKMDPEAEVTDKTISDIVDSYTDQYGPLPEGTSITVGANGEQWDITTPSLAPPKQYGFGMSKDQVVTSWKTFLDKTDPMIAKRHSEVSAWFKKFATQVKNQLGANLKAYGLHKSRDSEDADEITDIDNYEKLIAEYIAQVDASLADAYKYGHTDTLVKFDFEPQNDAAKKALQQYAASRIKGITDTTLEQVKQVLVDSFEEGVAVTEVAARLDEKFAEIESGRAETIARTETLTAVSLGREDKREEFKKEFPDTKLMKMWVSAQDEKVRDSHQELDGNVVEVDAEFKEGLRFPRDPNGAAEEVINCRCTDITMAAEDQAAVEQTLSGDSSDDEA